MARTIPGIARRIIPCAVLLVAALAAGPAGPASSAFAQAKPTIPLDQLCRVQPVRGERIVAFGQPAADGSGSKGVVIKTAPGAYAAAPCGGVIVFAGEFRNRGKLVIISPGHGYHILLAGLATADVEVGQNVAAGTRIGTLPQAPAGSAGPSLAIELRKDALPVDPTPLWRQN